MKKLLLISLIAQALVAPLLANKVLFIQNFQNNTKDNKYDHVGASLADMVISDIVALGVDGVEVVERARIKILLSELKLQESEYFDQATTQKMGKGLGANYALAGSFTVINGVMRIDARLINVTTSKIHSSFKTKGDEKAIFDLEAELVKHIGKGLEIDFGEVSRDKLSGPKELDTLVKYADADSLIQKGDYKAATKAFGEVRKSEPEFKLGKEAYKEAMRKLYAAKDKRTSKLYNSDKYTKLIDRANEKLASAKNQKTIIAYSAVRAALHYRKCMEILEAAGGNPKSEAFQPSGGKKINPPIKIPENRMNEFKRYLELYISAHHDIIKATDFQSIIKETNIVALILADHGISALIKGNVETKDLALMKDMGMKDYSFCNLSNRPEDLGMFMLNIYEFAPAPYQIDSRWEKLGFEMLELATAVAGRRTNKYAVRDSSRLLTKHGDIILKLGRTEDAIAKWQEILDTYPTYEGFKEVENKIKEALK